MNRRSLAFVFLSMFSAGCGRTQTGLAPTRMDARAVVDAVPSYPLVDDRQGGMVIDPQYAWHNFDGLLEGTWLIGWYGGQNHFSWIRFTPARKGTLNNSFQVLSKAAIQFNQPYWSCSGAGTWSPTARPMTVDLTMPEGCDREIMIFDSFRPVTDPHGAMLEARITTCSGSQCDGSIRTKIEGLKFPDSTCNAAFTKCESPF